MSAKVHLRLRFPNCGKPRTAGLCGRAAGACDCGPLSCAKIERPSPLEKPSCKVQLFAQNRSRNYRQKVTATTLFQTASYSDFQLLVQTAHVRFHERKWVRTRLCSKDRTQRLTRRNTGRFGRGRYYYPRSVPHVSETLRGQMSERQTLPFLGLGRVCSRRTQKAFGTAMRLCASLSRGVAAPAGCVIFFRFCRNCGLYALFQILLSVLQTLQLVPFLCKLRLSSFLFGSEFNGFRSKQAGFFAIIFETV